MSETQTDITKMSITDLKALAYDQLAMIENCQKNLVALNQEIAKRNPQATQSANP